MYPDCLYDDYLFVGFEQEKEIAQTLANRPEEDGENDAA